MKGGEVVLFAATFAGIKCFHYNGWHFVESQIESKDEATSDAIKAMHFYEYRDKSVVGKYVNPTGKRVISPFIINRIILRQTH